MNKPSWGKHSPLIMYFTLLILLCALVIGGMRMLGQQGAYLAQGYMLTPALAAILTRLCYNPPGFKDAFLGPGKRKDYLKFWLISLTAPNNTSTCKEIMALSKSLLIITFGSDRSS